MRKHTHRSRRATATALAACTALSFAGLATFSSPEAFADPAPKSGEKCVPVRMISADGSWTKGDKGYLDDILAKAKSASGGSLATPAVKVDDPAPNNGSGEQATDAKNTLTKSGIKTVVKLWNASAKNAVELGTADSADYLLGVNIDEYNDAGVKYLLDDGWVALTPAVAKAAAGQSQAAQVYRWAVENPPVLAYEYVNAFQLYYPNESVRNKARESYKTDDWGMVEKYGVRIDDKVLGSPDEAKTFGDDEKNVPENGKDTGSFIPGGDYLKRLRDVAANTTVNVVYGFDTKGETNLQDAAATKAAELTKSQPTPESITVPADVKAPPELPMPPNPWGGESDGGETPTVTGNGNGEEKPAATTAAADSGAGSDTELNGVPGGGSADTGDSGDGGTPSVTKNTAAPETPAADTSATEEPETSGASSATSSSPSNVTSDQSTTTSPSDSTSSGSDDPATPDEAKPEPKYQPSAPKVTGDQSYDKAKSALKKKLADTMTMVSKQCPQTMLALLGARQGAGAIGDLAADIGNGNGPVAPEKVVGVGLLSDPERAPMSGMENTVPDTNKPCVMDDAATNGRSSSGEAPTTEAVANKGGDDQVAPTSSASADPSAAGSSTPAAGAATSSTSPAAPDRTLGKSCADVPQQGGAGAIGQLIGDSVDGAGVYGQRSTGFGALSGRTATICVKSDATCASSRENTLVPLLARALSGDQKATPQAMQAAMKSATGMMKVLASINFGQITSMSSDVQKVAANAPLLGGAIGTMLVAPNPISAGVALKAAVPTAEGVLGIGGGVLKVTANLVQVYESTPELPQIVDFINLINPDTKTGKDLLSHIPGGNSPQTVGALRAVIPILNALNAIPKAQVLSLGGDISQTLGKSLTNPQELVTLLSQSVSLFSTVAGAATGVESTPDAFGQTESLVNPYPMGADGSATSQPVDYSAESVNRNDESATDWMGTWMGSQSQKAVQQVGTSGVSGDATFGGGGQSSTPTFGGSSDPASRPTYSGAPG